MAFDNPPSNIHIVTGTWGTEVDREETVYLSGSSSVVMTGAGASAIAGPMTPVSAGINTDRDYEVSVTVRADSVAAGKTVALAIEWYDAAGANVATTTLRAAAVLTAANTWKILSYRTSSIAATYKFARVLITKAASSFNLYVDEIQLLPTPPYISVTDSSLVTTAATWSAAAWSSSYKSDFNFVSSVVSAIYQRVTVIQAVVYFVTGVADGTEIGLRILIGGGVQSEQRFAVGAACTPSLSCTLTHLVAAGDAITVEVFSTAAETVSINMRALQPGA